MQRSRSVHTAWPLDLLFLRSVHLMTIFFCNLSHGSVPRCADLKMSIPGPRVNCQSTLLYNMSNAEDAQKSPYEFFRRVASHVNSAGR